MACMVAPTRRQLSKRIPFTKPTFLKSRVGMIRSLIDMSVREEIAEQCEACLLALFRMELYAEDVVASNGGGESLAVVGGGQHIVLWHAGHDITVEEVEIFFADGAEQRGVADGADVIPADMG